MALPTLESTWTHVNNTQLVYSTEANMTSQIFWRMTRALVACPNVTVRFSSSNVGTSAGIDGVDHLTTFASVQARTATATTANTSYIVARMAGVHSTFDVCIAHSSASASQISIAFSVGGNFVQAATTTHHPTATDISYSPASAYGGVALLNSAVNKRFHYSYTAAGDQLRFLVTTETTLAFNTLTDIGIVDGQYTSAWTGPEAHIAHITSAGASLTNSSIKDKFGITFTAPTTASVLWGYLASVNSPTLLSPENNNEWPVSPLYVWNVSNTSIYTLVCRYKDMYGVPSTLADGSYFPDPGTKTFIVMIDLLLPWDGSVLL